jgi:SAM-dependent methyltransferase
LSNGHLWRNSPVRNALKAFLVTSNALALAVAVAIAEPNIEVPGMPARHPHRRPGVVTQRHRRRARRPQPAHEGVERLRAVWNARAEQDPLGAILFDYAKRDRRAATDELMRRGVEEVADFFTYAARSGLAPRGRTTALDFGCGIGRTTQALSARFDRVIGVDIAPRMIALAESHNRYDHCEYLVGEDSDLARFEDATFDLVYSTNVLQHIPRALQGEYVGEFVRVLRPGGVVAVQTLPPSRLRTWIGRVVPRQLLDWYRSARYGGPPVELNPISASQMALMASAAGGMLLHTQPSLPAGGCRYFLGRVGDRWPAVLSGSRRES